VLTPLLPPTPCGRAGSRPPRPSWGSVGKATGLYDRGERWWAASSAAHRWAAVVYTRTLAFSLCTPVRVSPATHAVFYTLSQDHGDLQSTFTEIQYNSISRVHLGLAWNRSSPSCREPSPAEAERGPKGQRAPRGPKGQRRPKPEGAPRNRGDEKKDGPAFAGDFTAYIDGLFSPWTGLATWARGAHRPLLGKEKGPQQPRPNPGQAPKGQWRRQGRWPRPCRRLYRLYRQPFFSVDGSHNLRAQRPPSIIGEGEGPLPRAAAR